MEMDNQKLQKFVDAVNDEIEQKVNVLLNEAEEEKIAILENAKVKSKEAAEKRLADSKKKCELKYVRDITQNEMQMKKDVLLHREKLTDELMEDVKLRLVEFKSNSDYVDYLVKLMLTSNISDNSVIYLSSEDIKYSAKLKKAIKADNITFEVDSNIKIGGLSIYNKEKETIVNKTFDLLLEEEKQKFINMNAFAQ